VVEVVVVLMIIQDNLVVEVVLEVIVLLVSVLVHYEDAH
jgi:hypothetical protein